MTPSYGRLGWCFATPDANTDITVLMVSFPETTRSTNHEVIRASLREAMSK